MGAGEGEYTRKVHEALRTRCVHLFTKEMFCGVPEAHEEAFEADGAIFWCDQTGEGLGPDGSEVCEERCAQAGRACYEPPVRL